MLIVQKYGGSSVADAAKIERVAGIIADAYRAACGRDLLADLPLMACGPMGDAARAAFETSDCAPSRNLARLLEVYASARSAHDA